MISFLWGDGHDVDSEGNASTPASRDWTELYLRSHEREEEVVGVLPVEDTGLLVVESPIEALGVDLILDTGTAGNPANGHNSAAGGPSGRTETPSEQKNPACYGALRGKCPASDPHPRHLRAASPSSWRAKPMVTWHSLRWARGTIRAALSVGSVHSGSKMPQSARQRARSEKQLSMILTPTSKVGSGVAAEQTDAADEAGARYRLGRWCVEGVTASSAGKGVGAWRRCRRR